MTRKDILELKKRLNKTDCTITKMCGCYVDNHKNKVVKLSETFLNLEDDEFFKYLEIARKCLSGTVGNNLMQLDFPLAEEAPGGRQQFLMGLKESGLKNDALLETFYDLIIENYDYAGNYLILVFKDAYDIITRTSDRMKLDESEEVFDYLLCAICPVCLSKPGLGYREEENRIGARIRDWVVCPPDTGFVFPAFSDRSSDIHSLIYYIKDARDSRPEFVEDVLGCGAKRTAAEQQQVFHSIVKTALTEEDADSEELLLQFQENLQEIALSEDEAYEAEEPVVLTNELVEEALTETGIQGEAARQIKEGISREFENSLPEVKNLIDEKSLEKNAHKIYDVILRVKPEKAGQIKSETIDGQKYLIIPMDENEHINLNGVNTQV